MEIITSATIFKSFDGEIFTSEKECKECEKQRKEFLNNLKFFEVKYSPDLNETGLFTKCLFVAVYSESGFNKEIVINYCIKKFGYLGEGVQGHRFQTYFDVYPISFEKYTKGIIEDCRDEIHGYVCEVCHKEVFTTCADKGVTPLCISCECGGTMTHLKTYRKDTFPKDIKVFEFRRPSFKKMLKGGESMIQHVLNGGLVLDKTK